MIISAPFSYLLWVIVADAFISVPPQTSLRKQVTALKALLGFNGSIYLSYSPTTRTCMSNSFTLAPFSVSTTKSRTFQVLCQRFKGSFSGEEVPAPILCIPSHVDAVGYVSPDISHSASSPLPDTQLGSLESQRRIPFNLFPLSLPHLLGQVLGGVLPCAMGSVATSRSCRRRTRPGRGAPTRTVPALWFQRPL